MENEEKVILNDKAKEKFVNESIKDENSQKQWEMFYLPIDCVKLVKLKNGNEKYVVKFPYLDNYNPNYKLAGCSMFVENKFIHINEEKGFATIPFRKDYKFFVERTKRNKETNDYENTKFEMKAKSIQIQMKIFRKIQKKELENSQKQEQKPLVHQWDNKKTLKQ